MRLDRTLPAANAFASQFLASRRHAELIGREFGRIHAVHQIVFGGDSLPQTNRLAAKSAVQALVAGVVKDTEVLALNFRLPCRSRQHLEFFRRLLAKLPSFQVGSLLSGEFLPSRLNAKLLLRSRDLWLSGIAVLSNPVAGETGQLKVRDFSLPLLPTAIIFPALAK